MKLKNKHNVIDLNTYILANRKGSRDAELENATGFVSKHKVHRSLKSYSRKNYRIEIG